ncbi:MAG: type IV pilus assembly protein PilM [Actinomycetota bacterium]
MDLNKEIKLSDLSGLFRPKKAKKPAKAAPLPSRRAKSRRPRKHEVVGLKVGASQLAASRVVNNGGPVPRLVQLARQALEPGVVVHGEVRDVAALARELDRFFTEHELPRRGIRLGIGTNQIGVRTLDVDGIADERQLANAVRFRAHEALSIPIDQAVLDYHVVRETVDDSGSISRRVLLAAAYREPIDHYVQACRQANIELEGIDVEAFALLRAVAPERASANGSEPTAVIALALGHDRSTLAISDGKVCDFMRVLPWGGAKLESAIAHDLALAPSEAAELKRAVSLAAEAVPVDDPLLARAREAVAREVQSLARELVASLQFYQSQPESLAIGEILVTGGTTQLPGLAEELERLVRARVRIADPLAHVEVANTLAHRDDLASLAVAIGLGVDS